MASIRAPLFLQLRQGSRGLSSSRDPTAGGSEEPGLLQTTLFGNSYCLHLWHVGVMRLQELDSEEGTTSWLPVFAPGEALQLNIPQETKGERQTCCPQAACL